MKRIVVIGGGKGIFNVLQGLKKYPFEITAIVNTFDSGGSSGILRNEFGTLPFGDIRSALIALSTDTSNTTLQGLLNFRFKQGTLKGHSFGNLFLQALTSMLGSEIKAIKKVAELLKIKGVVLPISTDNAQVHALLENGKTIKGETNIDIPKHNGGIKIKKLYLHPKASIYKESREVLLKADFIIIGPGDLYSSILPNILVEGFDAVLVKTKAKIIYIPNIMTKWGETNNFKASDFLNVLLKYLKVGKVDYIICNSKILKNTLLKGYVREKARPVSIDLENLKNYSYNVILKDVVSQSDVIKHDPKKLADCINKIMK